MIISILAAIQQAPSASSPTPEEMIRDIAPPVEIPMPLWQIVLIGVGVAALLALLIWLAIRWRNNRPSGPPPTPRSIAIGELGRLRGQLRSMDPYAFSVAVSDVLRTYIGAQFGLRAREQTSPEFLAAITQAPGFSDDDRNLLAAFLERCDLIKFARAQADETTSEELLGSAVAFVQGGRA